MPKHLLFGLFYFSTLSTKEHKRRIFVKKTNIILLVVLLIIATTGCNIVSNEDENLTIVSTVPSVTEILFELKCGDNIIGVDSMSNYPEQTANIEKVGDYSGFDIEKVISLNPTIVFAGNMLQNEQITALKEIDINVISIEPTYFDDITASITEIGLAVNKEKEATELNKKITDTVSSVEDKASSLSTKPTIYYVMGIGEYGNWTSGEGSFINTVLTLAGGDCITDTSGVEWMDYPLEDLIVADPDILIVSSYVEEADLLADETYQELQAIENGSYYFINPDFIERPGPRITEALIFVQNCIIGE